MIRVLSRAAALAALLSLVGCNTHSAAPATPAGPPISVKAGDLLKEYSTNAAAADGKYKGKVLEVSGKFGSAQKAPLLGYVVQLQPEDAGELSAVVQCAMEESAVPEVAKLQEGQAIKIKGTCDGQVVSQVTLRHCTLEK